MLHQVLLTSFAAVFIGAADAGKGELFVGDPAPKLEIQEFVKGEPVKAFEPGKIYVVEFWATWCVPCAKSIPHLTALQKSHKNVTFIGVSIDDETDGVKPFVTKMGDKMDYRVAIEARDAGDKGRMSKTWLAASFQEGIPAAFIVNADGKVAWIGHPSELEKPLDQIIAGNWDLAAAAKKFKKEIAGQQLRARMGKLVETIQQSIQQKKYGEALKTINEFSEKNPDLETQLGPTKLALLAGFGNDPEKAMALVRQLINNAVKNKNAEGLFRVASALIDPRSLLPGDEDAAAAPIKIDGRLIKFAVEAAEKADELSETTNPIERAQIANLLARAYRADGQTDKAVEMLDRASELLTDTIRSAADTLAVTNLAVREAREELLKSAKTPPGSKDNRKSPDTNPPIEQDTPKK